MMCLMKKRNYQIMAFLLLAVLVTGCKQKPPTKTKEQVIQERVQERLDRWKADMIKSCVRDIEERAVALVDSTIIANAKANRDTAGVPPVPGRPVRPDFIPPEDTTPVKPFLRTGKDSLQ